MANDVIAAIQKGRLEEIHVGFSDFNGHQLLNARVWFEGDDGQMPPGKAGLAFKINRLPCFSDAVSLALEKARAKGFVQ